MDQLRAGTADLHERVETRMRSEGWLADRSRYVRLLRGLLTFHQDIEGQIGPFLGALPGLDLSGRGRIAGLTRDLHLLGEPADPLTTDAGLTIAGPEYALGVLYVTEGASRGGSMIVRLLHRDLGLTRETGAGSMDPYRTDTARRWREFAGVVNQTLIGADARTRALAGARAAFDGYEAQVLGGPGVGL